jgi:hypothetical protein
MKKVSKIKMAMLSLSIVAMNMAFPIATYAMVVQHGLQ